MIRGDPSRIDGRDFFEATSESDLQKALSDYGLVDQDGFMIMEHSAKVGRDVIIVKNYGEFEEAARNYLKGFPKA